jgi:hypothetical protein
VFISQNALRAEARSRSKADVEKIRHVYVDLDGNGEEALERIRRSEHVPEPNYVINTSPHKYQVVWKNEGMSPTEAESLQKAMVEAFDPDPAATDCARVLRLPGFSNKKYDHDYPATAQLTTAQIYFLANFRLPTDECPYLAGRIHHFPVTTNYVLAKGGHQRVRVTRGRLGKLAIRTHRFRLGGLACVPRQSAFLDPIRTSELTIRNRLRRSDEFL